MSENDPTLNENDAMDAMANTKGWYIAMARFIAAQIVLGRDPWYTLAKTGPRGDDLLRTPGTVHSYAVRMAMTRAGMLTGYKGKLFFLGAAFKGAGFLEPTGERFSYEHPKDDDEPGRAVHQRTIEVWREKKGGQIGSVPEPAVPKYIADRIASYKRDEEETARARERALKGR